MHEAGYKTVYHGKSHVGGELEHYGFDVAYENTEDFSTRLEASRFWRAAARRATLARVFAQHMHAATQAEAFTAALLLDMAVPLLAGVDSGGYAVLLDRWHADGAADPVAGVQARPCEKTTTPAAACSRRGRRPRCSARLST